MREGYAGLPYSDGEETEQRLLAQVIACRNVSDCSEELRACITDWPSEYHFSPLRANLLRPFSFAGLRVLELGCGCGAITRFLGEQGAEVIAVEGSPQRAAIAAARCRDLPNVRIYCDNLADFSSTSGFDAVTLIGVLEYSRLFLEGDDPVQSCLNIARAHLKDGGNLYLAIENQLGLKYFNGCNEDHTGIPYFGINDRYGARSVVTFGRKDLATRLDSAGFAGVEFFSPFPDYKLPELILSERGLNHPSLRVADLLCRMNSRDYGRTPLVAFNESLAWQVVARNGLAGELANSFLVRAGKSAGAASADWLARIYSTGRRREYATGSVIFAHQGELKVAKQRVFPTPLAASRFEHRTGVEAYVEGELHVIALQRVIANGGGFPEIAAWARPWLDFLRAGADDKDLLPGEYVDCIPTNLVRDQVGQLHYIDTEWRAETRIPFAWIAVRGLIISISASPPPHAIGKMSYRQFATLVLEQAGIALTEQDWRTVSEWEDALRVQCYGVFRGVAGFEEHLARTDLPWTVYPTCLEALDKAEAKLARLRSNILWKIYIMLRRMVGKE